MKLYKYVDPERIDILKTGLIRFSQPEVWNDPFEFNPFYEDHKEKNGLLQLAKLGDLFRRAKSGDMPTKEEIEEFDKENKRITKDDVYRFINRKIVSLSLTEDKDNLLLWSHYAKKHCGFVLEFDTETDFFHQSDFHLFKVTYSDKRPNVNTNEFATFMVSLVEALQNNIDFETEHLKKISQWLCKSNDWAYEKEWRLITTIEKAYNYHEFKERLNIIDLSDYENKSHFIAKYSIPISSIKAIYCGERMSRKLMRELYLMTKYNPHYSHIHLMHSVIDDTFYKLIDKKVEAYDVLSLAEYSIENGDSSFKRKFDPFYINYKKERKRYSKIKPNIK